MDTTTKINMDVIENPNLLENLFTNPNYAQFFHPFNCKKNTHLIKEGAIEEYLYFVADGIARLFVSLDAGNEATFAFSFPNEFINSFESFLNQQPSTYSIQAVTNLQGLRISKTDYTFLVNTYPEINSLVRMFLEQLFIAKIKREISLVTESKFVMFGNLLSREPKFMNQVPLKYIASYIGATPQAVSRFRRRIYEPEFIDRAK